MPTLARRVGTTLHHCPEMADMRAAYDRAPAKVAQQQPASESERSSSARPSSGRSYQTQTTDCSPRGTRTRPHVHYPKDEPRRVDSPVPFFDDRPTRTSPEASVFSISDAGDEWDDDADGFKEPIWSSQATRRPDPSPLPTTPSDFGRLFPSHRRLTIRHDDSTLDGNMNLLIDTNVLAYGGQRQMTLFHLRMQDLENREFSLRRYCRDSGREVCHSALKQDTSAAVKRSRLSRSLSNAVGSMLPRSGARTPPPDNLKRFDSGYGSMYSVDVDGYDQPGSADQRSSNENSRLPNVVRLEFSNYAHVDVNRRGSMGTQTYEYEYWGVRYKWKRTKHPGLSEVSFNLTRSGSDQTLGCMRPIPRTASEMSEEKRLGGWIAPYSMWIDDETIIHAQKDVADVVVACGLIALVDNAIRTRFGAEDRNHSRKSPSRASTGLADHVGATKLLNGFFRRRSSTAASARQASENWPTSSRPSSGSR